ncbi:MAG TPA: hydrogenase maturation protease [Actinomycetospora sp.]|nr:hydrogenase maturation protease [Actinomycetospora sp.]
MRILVAGVGNIFFGDDAFGSEVARRLLADPGALPPEVDVVDVGIRGMHLAYQMLDGYEVLVVVDAAPPRDDTAEREPGTLTLVEHDLGAATGDAAFDPHGMEPDAVLDLVAALARGVGTGGVGRVLVLGCVPGHVGPGMGLSAPVAAAVDEAVGAVGRIVERLIEHRPFTESGEPR